MAGSQLLERIRDLQMPWMFDRFADRHVVYCRRGADPGGIQLLNRLLGEVLSVFPPGSARLLLADPVGLGGSFQAFAALRDIDPAMISGMIWADPREIRAQLADIVTAIASISQNMLRDQHATIDDYNAAFAVRSGVADQPYRFVAIANFPTGFDQESCQLLERIMANGPRCGVHVLLDFDRAVELPHGVSADLFLNNCLVIDPAERAAALVQPSQPDLTGWAAAELDPPLSPSALAGIVSHHAGAIETVRKASAEYPLQSMFDSVFRAKKSPYAGITGRWTASAATALVIPLGQAGADRIESLVFGRDQTTTHHAIVLGAAGSGKSNLLHVMIQSAAELYAPDEVSLFLVDGKTGSEFDPYSRLRLPHARVIALESDPDFGRSILEFLEDEVERRNRLFRSAHVESYTGYRQQPGTAPLPRILAVFDEFQEMLRGENTLVLEVQARLARLARLGRSAGIHMVLSTQTLRGIDLPDDLLTQVGVRIVLVNAEGDWPKVLAHDNRGPSVLERGGQAILNDDFGSTRGNKQLQIARAFHRESMAAHINALNQEAQANPARQQADHRLFIFDGSHAAHLEESDAFAAMLAAGPQAAARRPRPLPLLVGEPIAMLPTHALALRRQTGSNVLILEREQDVAEAAMLAMLLSAMVQRGPGNLQIDLFDLAGHQGMDEPDFVWSDLEAAAPGCVQVHGPRDIEDMFAMFGEALEKGALPVSRTRLIVLHGIHRARGLWDEPRGYGDEDEPQAPRILQQLLRQGPEAGFHVIMWCDAIQNLERAIGRELQELGLGLVGRLDSGGSMRVLDDDLAAALDRDNRMVAYDKSAGKPLQVVRRFELPALAWRDKIFAHIGDIWRKDDNV
jgi:hypothetical protein